MHTQFTPTSASWLDLVEHRLALPSTHRLARGASRRTRARAQAIERRIRCLAATNADPEPFVRTSAADESLASVARYRQPASDSRYQEGSAFEHAVDIPRLPRDDTASASVLVWALTRKREGGAAGRLRLVVAPEAGRQAVDR